MKKLLTAGLAAMTLGGSILGAAAPASARDWDHHGGHGGHYHDNGAAVAAGIAGLAVGAALAGGNGYHAPQGYYYGPPPAYYDGPAYYSYYHSCRVTWRWDPYWGRYVRVRACY